MRVFCCLIALLLPSAASADYFSGIVVVFRPPTAKDDGLLVVKKDVIAKDVRGKEVRILRERSFVFARHLAEGRYLPEHDRLFRSTYRHMPGDVRQGHYVSLNFKVDAKGRGVVQGLKSTDTGGKQNRDMKPGR